VRRKLGKRDHDAVQDDRLVDGLDLKAVDGELFGRGVDGRDVAVEIAKHALIHGAGGRLAEEIERVRGELPAFARALHIVVAEVGLDPLACGDRLLDAGLELVEIELLIVAVEPVEDRVVGDLHVEAAEVDALARFGLREARDQRIQLDRRGGDGFGVAEHRAAFEDPAALGLFELRLLISFDLAAGLLRFHDLRGELDNAKRLLGAERRSAVIVAPADVFAVGLVPSARRRRDNDLHAADADALVDSARTVDRRAFRERDRRNHVHEHGDGVEAVFAVGVDVNGFVVLELDDAAFLGR